MNKWKVLRVLYGTGASFCLFSSLIPALFYGITHMGVILFLLGGILLTEACVFLPRLRSMRHFRIFHGLFFTGIVFAFGIYAGFGIFYRSYCIQNPPAPAGEVQTVIVLGGGIEGDQPKLMLALRLDTAAAYLVENPVAQCIVSGGMGEGEQYSEAYVMRKYLIESGISPDRIEMEDQSRNTRENIAFSAECIETMGLSQSVTIVSDGFHQARAAYFCRQNHLIPHALPSHTPWGLLPSYEVREMGAWIKALLGW